MLRQICLCLTHKISIFCILAVYCLFINCCCCWYFYHFIAYMFFLYCIYGDFTICLRSLYYHIKKIYFTNNNFIYIHFQPTHKNTFRSDWRKTTQNWMYCAFLNTSVINLQAIPFNSNDCKRYKKWKKTHFYSIHWNRFLL